MTKLDLAIYIDLLIIVNFGLSLSWSYCSWICNYLYNQCISPLKWWVQTPFMARCTWYNILW